MTFNRNSKIPFIVYFFIYWIYYDTVWTVLAALFIYIVLFFQGKTTPFFSILFDIDYTWLGFLLPMFLVTYYTMGSMVESISIDKSNKTLKIIYYPLVFFKKEKVFFLEDNSFKYVYQSSKKTVLTYIQGFDLLFFNVLKFYNKGNLLKAIILHDVAGWNASQIKTINEELLKLKSE